MGTPSGEVKKAGCLNMGRQGFGQSLSDLSKQQPGGTAGRATNCLAHSSSHQSKVGDRAGDWQAVGGDTGN